jgi:hypothetical protein
MVGLAQATNNETTFTSWPLSVNLSSKSSRSSHLAKLSSGGAHLTFQTLVVERFGSSPFPPQIPTFTVPPHFPLNSLRDVVVLPRRRLHLIHRRGCIPPRR